MTVIKHQKVEGCKHNKTWISSHYEKVHKYEALVELEKCMKCGKVLNKVYTIDRKEGEKQA